MCTFRGHSALLSRFIHVQLCATPEMAAYQALLSLGFSRQEHWNGLPFPFPMHESEKWKWSPSVVSNSSRSHGLQPTRLLCPWDFPGKSTGVGCHRLLHGTLLDRGKSGWTFTWFMNWFICIFGCICVYIMYFACHELPVFKNGEF